MSFFSWLRNRTSIGSRQGRAQPRPAARRFRPTLEALEGRCVPSTLKVTNTADSGPGSLRYEIAQAQSGDTIVFKVSGTITLTTGELGIAKNLTIKGPGAGQLTLTSIPWVNDYFQSEPGSRVFEVDGASTAVTISGLTISNAGGTVEAGSLAQTYDGWGGGILNFGQLTVGGCTLSGDSALYGGGAIANFGAMTVNGCTLTGNFGDFGAQHLLGGGIYNAGTMTVSSSTISGLAPGWGKPLAMNGGGIYNAGAMTVSGCTLSGNYAVLSPDLHGGDGGGLYNAGTMTVSGCTLSGNSASVEGGGIYNSGAASALTVLDSIFSSNSPNNLYGPYTDSGGNTFG